MKSFIKLFFIFSVVLLFFACDATSHKLENQIYIRFREINFNGDWTHFADTKVDSMEITLQKDIYLQEADAIKLKENITYSAGKQPSLPNLDTENPIIFRPNEKEPKLESVKTTFFRGNSADRTIDTNVGQRLRRGSINDLALTYDMRTESQVDFSASISNNETAIINSNEDGFYNFDVNVNHVKKSNFSTHNSINFVVMAEGYRTDEMRYFRSYVEDAFANYGNFHYTKRNNPELEHIPNDFFKEWWDYINVFSFETVSPHSGIDTEFFRNYIQSFFDVNRANQLQFGSARMKKVIDENMNKTGLHRKDVDVYILFVNDPKIWAYSFAYFIDVDNRRNDQPVTAVIIQTPARRDINADDFHSSDLDNDRHNDGVKTDAIAHELGHAIAQLMDEYGSSFPYFPFFRNISRQGYANYKWQAFIDYDKDYFDSTPIPMPYNNNKLVDRLYPNYSGRAYYIPTMNSTMKADEASENYQFGPVNTYFMEGSFMVRLGMLPPQKLMDILGISYSWNGYSIADFHKRWPPSRFE